MFDAKSEMEGLWTAVFGQPPAIDAEPALLAQLIIRCSGPPPVYETFAPPSSPAPPDSETADERPLSQPGAVASVGG